MTTHTELIAQVEQDIETLIKIAQEEQDRADENLLGVEAKEARYRKNALQKALSQIQLIQN